MAPHDCYRCAGEDRWVSIAVGSDEEWTALKAAIGDPFLDEDRFAGPAERWQNQDALDPIIERWTRQREVGDVVSLLQAAGVPAMRVHVEDSIAEDPHVAARGFIGEIEHPEIGLRKLVGVPWRFGAGGVGIRRHAPLLGQHNDYVLGELLGLPKAEIERLGEQGTLR
jgi:benzylsuccinate CoA-transferase BbsF subunit